MIRLAARCADDLHGARLRVMPANVGKGKLGIRFVLVSRKSETRHGSILRSKRGIAAVEIAQPQRRHDAKRGGMTHPAINRHDHIPRLRQMRRRGKFPGQQQPDIHLVSLRKTAILPA